MTTIAPPAVRPKSSQAALSTYEAAVVHGFNEPLAIEQVPALRLESGQVRVRIEACGLFIVVHRLRKPVCLEQRVPQGEVHLGMSRIDL